MSKHSGAMRPSAPRKLQLSPELKELLEARRQEVLENPGAGVPWDEIKSRLLLDPQPEGGFVVTSPVLPELITEGDTIPEALANAQDALAAVVEAYEDLRRPLPQARRPARLAKDGR